MAFEAGSSILPANPDLAELYDPAVQRIGSIASMRAAVVQKAQAQLAQRAAQAKANAAAAARAQAARSAQALAERRNAARQAAMKKQAELKRQAHQTAAAAAKRKSEVQAAAARRIAEVKKQAAAARLAKMNAAAAARRALQRPLSPAVRAAASQTISQNAKKLQELAKARGRVLSDKEATRLAALHARGMIRKGRLLAAKQAAAPALAAAAAATTAAAAAAAPVPGLAPGGGGGGGPAPYVDPGGSSAPAPYVDPGLYEPAPPPASLSPSYDDGGYEDAPAEEAPAEEAPEEAPAEEEVVEETVVEETPAEETPAEEASAEASSPDEDFSTPPVEGDAGPAPHHAAKGVWLKTHIYQEGHLLKSVTYMVAQGEVEVLRFEVDLRPIVLGVIRYHQKLHEEGNSKPTALRNRDVITTSGYEVGGIFDSIAKVFTAPVKAVKNIAKGAVKAVTKIPVVGDAIKAIGRSKLGQFISKGVSAVTNKISSWANTLSPRNLISNILKGQRIDQALLNDFKSKLSVAKEVAPYVQTVVSMVPGIGTGVAGAIAAATAVAEGKKITDVFISAARGAIPGGPAAQAAFDLGTNLIKGQRLDMALLNTARNRLPEAAKRAFDAGVALQQGKALQALSSVAVPSLHLPKMSGISDQAMAAFATANNALHKVAQVGAAKKAVANVTNAQRLVWGAKKAVEQMGPEKAQASIAALPPAARAKLQRAANIAKLGQKLNPVALRELALEEKFARDQIRRIQTGAAQGNPVAQANENILRIVAQARKNIASVAAAHSGGVPSMRVGSRGRIVRGRCVRPSNVYLDPTAGTCVGYDAAIGQLLHSAEVGCGPRVGCGPAVGCGPVIGYAPTVQGRAQVVNFITPGGVDVDEALLSGVHQGLGSILGDDQEEARVLGEPLPEPLRILVRHQLKKRYDLKRAQAAKLAQIRDSGGDVEAAKRAMEVRRNQLVTAQKYSRQLLRERLHQHT